jgi:hypothetical protein
MSSGPRDPQISWLIKAVQELARASHEDTLEEIEQILEDGYLPLLGGTMLGGIDMDTFALDASGGSLLLPQSTTPTPTAEGSLAWDTNDNLLVLGDGANSRRLSNWELIGIATPSSVASVEFTNLSAYRVLRHRGWLAPANDGVAPQFRTSTNNGSSYDSGASDYAFFYVYSNSPTTVAASQGVSVRANLSAASTGNAANEKGWWDYTMLDFNQATRCLWQGIHGNYDTAAAFFNAVFHGERRSTTARDAIQFSFSAGNIASGYIMMEGIRG